MTRRFLRLVDNGTLLPKLTMDIQNLGDYFARAKISDQKLGEDEDKNDEVLKLYLDTAFQCKQVKRYVNSKVSDIEAAQISFDSISEGAKKHSFFEGIAVNLASSALVLIITAVFGFIVGYIVSIKPGADLPDKPELHLKQATPNNPLNPSVEIEARK